MKRAAARPSPAIAVAAVALVAALAGTAVAGPTATSSVSKKQVKKTAKKEAAKYFDANIGDASVASAQSAQSAQTATTAGSAGNASQLGGQSPSAFRTGVASAQLTNAIHPETDSTVLSTTIALPSTKTVTAVATIQATLDGVSTDSIACRSRIAGTDGLRQEVDIEADGHHASVPVTQSLTLAAGTHTVLVQCSTGSGDPSVEVSDRALSVVATG